MHAIVTDLETGVIEVAIEGFWTLDHVAVFAREVQAAARTVLQAGKRQAILYDYTNASIQSVEVVAAMESLAQDNAFRSRKVALYTNRILAKRQAIRIAAQGRAMQVFDDRAAAMTWLLAA